MLPKSQRPENRLRDRAQYVGGAGHQRRNCPKVLKHCKDGVLPLPINDAPSRLELASRLREGSGLETKEVPETTNYSKTWPRLVTGVVLHRRVKIPVTKRGVVCLGITVLTTNMEVSRDFIDSLFELDVVLRYITRGKNTIVVNNIPKHLGEQGGFGLPFAALPSGMSMNLSQNTLGMTYLSNPAEYSQLDTMGFGMTGHKI